MSAPKRVRSVSEDGRAESWRAPTNKSLNHQGSKTPRDTKRVRQIGFDLKASHHREHRGRTERLRELGQEASPKRERGCSPNRSMDVSPVRTASRDPVRASALPSLDCGLRANDDVEPACRACHNLGRLPRSTMAMSRGRHHLAPTPRLDRSPDRSLNAEENCTPPASQGGLDS